MTCQGARRQSLWRRARRRYYWRQASGQRGRAVGPPAAVSSSSLFSIPSLLVTSSLLRVLAASIKYEYTRVMVSMVVDQYETIKLLNAYWPIPCTVAPNATVHLFSTVAPIPCTVVHTLHCGALLNSFLLNVHGKLVSPQLLCFQYKQGQSVLF